MRMEGLFPWEQATPAKVESSKGAKNQLFDIEDHEGADDAGDEADEERRHGLNEAGGLGDGGQSGDRAECSGQRDTPEAATALVRKDF